LGNDGEGTFARNIDANAVHGNRFQAPVDMRISNIQAKVIELAGASKCAVFGCQQRGGAAGRGVDVSANQRLEWFCPECALGLTGGDWYWLVIWSDTAGARVQADIFGVGYVEPVRT
jgi:hypothetical protein